MKRALAWLAALGFMLSCAAASAARAEDAVVRIGYQKASALMAVLRSNGTLEQALSAKGYRVQWSEFAYGVPLIEALNVGGIDLTADVGDPVPIFGQAAGARLVYFAQESAAPAAQGVLVPKASPIQTVSDLKGRKIAFAKGSCAHYLIIAVLRSAGLTLADVQPVYLAPADARAALERGSVDAWAIWEPFQAAFESQTPSRLIANGEHGIASYHNFYLTSPEFLAKHVDALAIVYQQLHQTGAWVKAHPDAAAALLAPVWGLDAGIARRAIDRRSFDVGPTRPTTLDEQQRIADAFFAAKLLPKAVDARALPIWKPES